MRVQSHRVFGRCYCFVYLLAQGVRIRKPVVGLCADLRTQALRFDVRSVDAVLFTHGHADHLHGLDDVRSYCFGRDEPIPVYGDRPTLDRITRVFDYAFDSAWATAVPRLSLHPLDPSGGDRRCHNDAISCADGQVLTLGLRAFNLLGQTTEASPLVRQWILSCSPDNKLSCVISGDT